MVAWVYKYTFDQKHMDYYLVRTHNRRILVLFCIESSNSTKPRSHTVVYCNNLKNNSSVLQYFGLYFIILARKTSLYFIQKNFLLSNGRKKNHEIIFNDSESKAEKSFSSVHRKTKQLNSKTKQRKKQCCKKISKNKILVIEIFSIYD